MPDNKTNDFENEVLLDWFNDVGNSLVGTPNLYVALFTANPTETGAATNEATYTGYARVAVARTAGGWTVSGSIVSNTAAVSFPQCTGGTNTITHAAICKGAVTGVADLIIYGPLSTSLSVSNGVLPQFAVNNLVFEEK